MIKPINAIIISTGIVTGSICLADDNVSTEQNRATYIQNALIEGPSGVSRQLEEEENAYVGIMSFMREVLNVVWLWKNRGT
jgi:hypothetical protein